MILPHRGVQQAAAPQELPGAVDSDNHTLADFYDSEDPDLFAKVRPFLAFIRDMQAKGTYTYRRTLCSACANTAKTRDRQTHAAREMLMMASNNYLGLNTRPEVREAAREAIARYGTSMCGAPLLNGTYDLLEELEARLAAFTGKEAAVVFPTGYSANAGTISALMRAKDLVLIDRLDHASIVDGCRLSGCACHSFRHNDADHLERLLRRYHSHYRGKLVIVDGVFSMHGDLACLPEIVNAARRYGAKLMVDEAHALGVIGPRGAGAADHFGLRHEVDIVMGTFSKSLASTGGFIAASGEVVNYVRHYARSYFFSASPTPPTVAAVLAALDIIEREPQLRARLWDNVRYLHGALAAAGFRVEPTPPESAVLVVTIGSSRALRALSRDLHGAGIYLNSVEYPAVPKDQARLRLGVMATHAKDELDTLVATLAAAADRSGIARGPNTREARPHDGPAGAARELTARLAVSRCSMSKGEAQ